MSVYSALSIKHVDSGRGRTIIGARITSPVAWSIAAALLAMASVPARAGVSAAPSTASTHAFTTPKPVHFQGLSAEGASPGSLLDEMGHLAQPVAPLKLTAWKTELHRGHLPADQAAKLHIWLGEYELAANEQPELATWHFAQVSPHAAPRLRGLAKYDTALATYFEGAFADSQQSLKRLLSLKTGLPGYNIKSCALWARLAGVCAGYHAQRAKMGIPEPTRLDPYCGAAALAECLKVMGRPYSRATLTAACHITGEGSSLKDLVDAGKRLGVVVRAVTANDAGLMAMPKPVIAHIERDHFIVVTHADKRSVTYLCSDCGPWPGGKVQLTWNQWHELDPDIYGAVTRRGTTSEDWMAAVLTGKRPPARVAGMGPLKGLIPALQAGALIRIAPVDETWPACQSKPAGPVCPCFIPAPKDGGGPGGGGVPGAGGPGPHLQSYVPASPGGASSGDPVDLASGGEEYSPDPDLTVYNPLGPSVSFQRTYASLDAGGAPGLGMGWSDSLTAAVVGSKGGYFDVGTAYLVMPNDGLVTMNVPDTPTAQNPRIVCPMQPGAPILAEWDYDGSTEGHVLITFSDRTQWRFDQNASAPVPQFELTQISDRNGNAIRINYDPTGAYPTSVTNSAGTTLLTLNYTTFGYGGTLTSISDAYGRSVYYQAGTFGSYGSGSYPELTEVSQIVPTGTVNPPLRYTYDYQIISAPGGESVPFLHTITVPSPTGAGNSTAAINNTSAGYVGSLVDANGNSRSYSFPDSNHTTVTVTNPQQQVAYSYTAGYDNNMNGTTTTDGTGTVTGTSVFQDPNDPYRPSQLIDGNGSNTNPGVNPGSASTFVATGGDAPATETWDIVLNQNIVGSSATPNGWNVSLDNTNGLNNFTVSAPTGATIASGYEVRYGDDYDFYEMTWYSAHFDIVAPGTIRKGTTSYTWDQYGNMLSATSPRGTTTTNTYNYINFALGELAQTQTGTKSPTSYTYYEPSGDIHTVTSPLPGTVGSNQTVTTTYNWDALGNLTSVVAPGNNSAATITTTFGYTTDGSYQQAEALREPLTVTDNLSHVSHYRYDSRSNRTVEIDPLGNEYDTSFNLADDWVILTHPATGETGTGHATTTNTYLYTGGPLTAVTCYDESGAQVGQATFTYGPEGEMLSRAGQQQPFTYGYDALYRPISLSDGDNHPSGVSYNTAGYLSEVSWPGGQSSQFTEFDFNGNVLKRVDGNNVETDYAYNDPESRLTDIEYPATPSLNAHFIRDSYGRRIQMTDSTGVQSWTYDDRNGTLTDQTTYTGVPAQTIGYSYYPNGSCETMTTSAGTFSYGFDRDGRLNSLTNPFSETSQWTYLDNNWLASETLGDGAASYLTYNARGFLTRLQNETSSMTSLSDFGGAGGMQYDSLGNRLSMQVNIPGSGLGTGTTSFSYNPQNELTQESSSRNGNYSNSFGYDAAFNPTTFRGATNTFNTNSQDNSLTFDGNGSPTDYNGVTTTFDPEGRLTQYGSLLTAGYNGFNFRAWKQNSAGRTYYLYSGRVPIIEMNGSGTVTAVNTFGADGLVSRHSGGTSVYYTFDPSGNVVQRLGGSQNVLSTLVFDSFGKELSGGNTGEPWGFGARAGYYTDNETGLQLLTYRYYDPGRGRFLTRDPLGDGGGINQYAYVANNPAGFDDSTGLFVGGPAAGGSGGGTATGVGEGAGEGAGAGGVGEAGGAGVGEAGGVGLGDAAGPIIGAGTEAGWELWNYNMNDPCHATGPFTAIGVWIGDEIFHDCHITIEPPLTPEECLAIYKQTLKKKCEPLREKGDLDGFTWCVMQAGFDLANCIRRCPGGR